MSLSMASLSLSMESESPSASSISSSFSFLEASLNGSLVTIVYVPSKSNFFTFALISI